MHLSTVEAKWKQLGYRVYNPEQFFLSVLMLVYIELNPGSPLIWQNSSHKQVEKTSFFSSFALWCQIHKWKKPLSITNDKGKVKFPAFNNKFFNPIMAFISQLKKKHK